MKSIVTFIILASVLLAPVTEADDLRESIAADYDDRLEALFIHFHQNPELSDLEFETAKRMASEIRSMGFEVTEGIGGTGVVAVLENGPGPVVMIRADMDGLPLREDSGLEYASTAVQVDKSGNESPVMHACGHDVHITALLGTAHQLMERRDQWSGTLVLVVQPAEETISGARVMLEDGLYERFPKPEYALAFHVSAGMEAGKILVRTGAVYSSSDRVEITVHGVGAHGAYPHQGVDPVLVAAQIVVSLQSIVSRSISPLQPGVISVGVINGGTKNNIIPDRVEMQLTVRSDSPEIRTKLLDGIDRVAEGVARSLGVPEDLLPEVRRSSISTTPPTVNDAETAERVLAALREGMGESYLIDSPRSGMGAEDFAYFVQPELGVKGVNFSVGGTAPEDLGQSASHHSPFFKVEPGPSVRSAVEAFVVAAMDLMPPAKP